MGKHPTTFNKLTYNIIRYWFDLQEYGDFTWRVSDCEEMASSKWACRMSFKSAMSAIVRASLSSLWLQIGMETSLMKHQTLQLIREN